jgi:hypothetical protein
MARNFFRILLCNVHLHTHNVQLLTLCAATNYVQHYVQLQYNVQLYTHNVQILHIMLLCVVKIVGPRIQDKASMLRRRQATLAQWVTLELTKCKVAGSIPVTSGDFLSSNR